VEGRRVGGRPVVWQGAITHAVTVCSEQPLYRPSIAVVTQPSIAVVIRPSIAARQPQGE